MSSGLESVLMLLLGLSSNPQKAFVCSMALFISLLCVCIVIGHFLERSRWMNESVVALLIGLGTGTIILVASKGKSSRVLQFEEQLFFIYLLPPIIFNAGFQVQKKQFFRNFIIISLFGAAGTLISFCVTSFGAKALFETLDIGYFELRDYLAIGAILSATDSVCTLQVLNQDETPLLYSLVFGEGMLNDATCVVLFNSIQRFDLSNTDPTIAFKFFSNFVSLFVTSTLLGVVTALICAYGIKKLYLGRHSTDREVALMILMAYLSYIIAEILDWSGILTVFFCGIVMSHYTAYNVTEGARVTSRHACATMSFIAELFIFLYVGMDALDIEKWKFVKSSPVKCFGASALLLGLVMVARALFIFPISFLSNLTKKTNSDKLSINHQVIIWWAGLMRGAVSMALAYNQFAKSGHTQQPGNAIMITCTITVVLFSTVVFGLLTKPLIRYLLPPTQHSITVSLEPSSPMSSSMTLPLISNGRDSEFGDTSGRHFPSPPSFRMLLSTPTTTVHYYWRKFDNTFMRPVFGGLGFSRPYTYGSESDLLC